MSIFSSISTPMLSSWIGKWLMAGSSPDEDEGMTGESFTSIPLALSVPWQACIIKSFGFPQKYWPFSVVFVKKERNCRRRCFRGRRHYRRRRRYHRRYNTPVTPGLCLNLWVYFVLEMRRAREKELVCRQGPGGERCKTRTGRNLCLDC